MRLIAALQLKFGATKESPLTIQNPAVTVFVGPNNSGKSLVLRELNEYLASGESKSTFDFAILSDDAESITPFDRRY